MDVASLLIIAPDCEVPLDFMELNVPKIGPSFLALMFCMYASSCDFVVYDLSQGMIYGVGAHYVLDPLVYFVFSHVRV